MTTQDTTTTQKTMTAVMIGDRCTQAGTVCGHPNPRFAGKLCWDVSKTIKVVSGSPTMAAIVARNDVLGEHANGGTFLAASQDELDALAAELAAVYVPTKRDAAHYAWVDKMIRRDG